MEDSRPISDIHIAEIHADPGGDVTLPCHLSTETSVVAMEVKWLKRTDCIYLYKNGRGAEERTYEGRRSVISEDLQRGHVSLRLRGVTHSDSGLYRCQVVHGDCKVDETLIPLCVRRLKDEKIPVKRVRSASIYDKPNLAGHGTSETLLELVCPQAECSAAAVEGSGLREASKNTQEEVKE